MKRALLAATLLALPLAAQAQPIEGLYLGASGGANWMSGGRLRLHTPSQNGPTLGTDYNTGAVALGSLGWGFGNGVRIEAEGGWRTNNGLNGGPNEQKYGAMANVLFDMDIGSPWVFPYLGGGFGSQWVRVSTTGAAATDPAFAYQAMLGAAFPIPWVVGLSATTEFRYLGVAGKRKLELANGATALSSDDNNFALMAGLRYAFNVTPPPPPPAPAAAAAPAPAPARSYLVFFDWDSAALSARARQIIAEAAQNSTRVQVTRIEVAGNADRSGSPAYNRTLSKKRAETVAGELVRLGVAKNVIDIQAFGDTKPLVPTAAGVREAQNRRVEIVLK
jgi:OmpA-OmpF porin, OOP family